MRAARRALALAGVVLVTLVASAVPAAAHASLLGTEPADQAQLDVAPEQVTFRFNEPVTPDPDGVRVVSADGGEVDEGLVGSGTAPEVTVALPDDLPDGAYAAAIAVISADGHRIRAAITFAVGDADAAGLDVGAVAGVGEGGSVGLDAAAAVGRAVLYAAALLAAGGVLFLVVVVRRDQADDAVDGQPHGSVGPLLRAVTVGGVVALVATLYGWAVQAAQTSSAGLGALVDPGALAAVAEQGFGQSAGIRLIGLAVLLLAVSRWGAGWAQPVALGGAAVALGSFLLDGHTATTEPRWLVLGADVVHVAAAAAWFGGLVLLVLAMRGRRADDDVEGAGDLVARFSGLATVAVVAVGLAGLALGWAETRSWDALVSTTYGRLLLVKVGLVAVVAGVGGYNNRRLVPALRSSAAGQAWGRLRRTVRFEAAVLVVALGVTGVLVNTVPARTVAAESGSAMAGPFQETAALGDDLEVDLVVEPSGAGHEVHLYLVGAGGTPLDLDDAPASVSLRLTNDTAGVGPIDRSPVAIAPTHYVLSTTDLALAGDWTVEVQARVDDFTVERTTFTVPTG
jgi:copper transport protein